VWECKHYNRKGEWVETVKNTGHTCQGCGTPYTRIVTACPKCGAQKGPDGWQGTNCRACGYVAFTYGHGQGNEGHRQIAYARRIHRLFGAVGVDEAQLAKNVQALRGQAVHSLKARGRALLTGTLMRGYVTDLFWNVGWLLGQGGPLWPFAHRGGSRRFLAQFGTFEYVTKEFEDTLSSGKRKQIPSVSNLVRLWRLLAPAAIRRLKTDVLAELPAKHRHVEWVEPGPTHAAIVGQVEVIVEDAIANELRLHPDDPCMGVISRALWWARYAASCPDENGLPYYSEAFGIDLRPELPQSDEEAAALLGTYREAAQHMGVNTGWLDALRQPEVRQEIGKLVEMMAQRLLLDGKALPLASGFPKVQRAVEIVRAAHRSGEKTIIFTSLRALLASTVYHLKQAGLNPTVITAETPARKRLEVIQRFQSGSSPVLVAGLNVLNRGFTITAANHVVILNVEWSPEDTTQAEDRVHRPGQTRGVHVHYLLTPGSAEEDMYQLISDKDAAQRSVTDKLARDRDVADLLKQAASAQLKVAQRLVTRRAEKPVTQVVPAAAFGRREKPKPQPKQARPALVVGAIQLSFFDVAA
jgi:SNF2 family DNA or RNA helicase